MSAAEIWRGAELAVPRAQAAALPQGRHYVFEVVGLRVITEAGQDGGTGREILRAGGKDAELVDGGARAVLSARGSCQAASVQHASGALGGRPVSRPLGHGDD